MAVTPPPRPVPENATVADLGEFGLIGALTDRFEQTASTPETTSTRDDVLIGPGDDAAAVRVRTGHVLVSTDVAVDERHFRRDWATGHDIGRRAAAQNLSDINAMGGRATTLTVGLAMPPELLATWVLDLADGLGEEASRVGACVVGGDVTRSPTVTIAVTVLGVCEEAPVRRSGAAAGEVLGLCGRQGWAAAGLAVLARGFRSPRALVDSYRRPEPPYEAGAQAAAAGATAMIDVSDGLLADAGHIATASGVGINVHSAAFEIAEPLRAVGAALGTDPMEFVLGGGDDHALLATFPSRQVLPAGWQAIGEVHSGDGVTVDGAAYEGSHGHRHF